MTFAQVEVAPGVLVVTLPEAAMNAVLVVDDGEVLVVDVGATPNRGAELRALAERRGRVVAVVVTHPHWDHVFGLGAFADVPSHAHPAAIDDLRDTGALQRDALVAQMAGEVPDWLRAFVPPLPTHPVAERLVLRVGGIDVVLDPVGHAHTVGDLVLHVPARGVSVLGDLVEVGDPPQLHDADLAGWVAALDRLAPDLQPIVVPGHGDVTTPGSVAEQRDLLAAGLAHLRGEGPAPEGLDLTQLPG
ncbi:MBL fold metallo-hydrolase [Agrococcus jejuensis]|uniref:Glyoxylase, beta-lactamase superfamily II n=1 Tax=Agrococcus jejuensis TaxID=399736 RepID=A0A1G8F3E3_9MICO|nr:MBL fold metallo-hydrolase [Agrococcus jejuensis]SDH76529.1 Glyoxylase, beta-lactamase superfamily II [Agrococcus jejuensis]